MLLGFKALWRKRRRPPVSQLYEALRIGSFDGQRKTDCHDPGGKIRPRFRKYLDAHPAMSTIRRLLVMSPDVFDDLSTGTRRSSLRPPAGRRGSRQFAGEAQRTGIAALQAEAWQVVAGNRPGHRFAAAMASGGSRVSSPLRPRTD